MTINTLKLAGAVLVATVRTAIVDNKKLAGALLATVRTAIVDNKKLAGALLAATTAVGTAVIGKLVSNSKARAAVTVAKNVQGNLPGKITAVEAQVAAVNQLALNAAKNPNNITKASQFEIALEKLNKTLVELNDLSKGKVVFTVETKDHTTRLGSVVYKEFSLDSKHVATATDSGKIKRAIDVEGGIVTAARNINTTVRKALGRMFG